MKPNKDIDFKMSISYKGDILWILNHFWRWQDGTKWQAQHYLTASCLLEEFTDQASAKKDSA